MVRTGTLIGIGAVAAVFAAIGGLNYIRPAIDEARNLRNDVSSVRERIRNRNTDTTETPTTKEREE